MKSFRLWGLVVALMASLLTVPAASAAVATDPRYPKVKPFCYGAGAAVYACEPQKKVIFDPLEYGPYPPVTNQCDPATGGLLESCVIGDVWSDKSIAVVGSSHARLLWPAFDIVGEHENAAVHVFFLNNCHYMVTVVSECSSRNLEIRTRILAGEFDLVIFAQAVDRNEDGVEIISATNYRTYYQELKREDIPFTVIKDGPMLTDATMKCQKKNKRALWKCTEPRATAFRYTDFAVQAATALSIPVLDFSHLYCDVSTCPVIRGGMKMYTDTDHIVPGFGRTFAPFMWSELRRVGLLPVS